VDIKLKEQAIQEDLAFDPEEVSILLIGNEEEQNRAIYLIDKHLRSSVIYKIRKTALGIPPDEVMEIYQEALLNVLEAAREQRYDPDQPFLPFLFTLAYRRACDRIRKNNTKKENEKKLLDEISQKLKGTKVGEAWELVAQKNDGSRVIEAIRRSIIKMPTRQRQVAEIMIDFFPDKPSNQKICEEILRKTSEPTTIVAVKRAKQEARKKIYELLVSLGYLEELLNG